MKPVLELLKNFYIQRIVVYFVIAVFSFLVIVPLGDLRLRFTDGHCSRCLLYSKVMFAHNTSSAQTYCVGIEFGEQEVCEYSIAVSSVFCLIYPLLFAVVYFFMYRRDNAETRDENKLDLAQGLFLLHIMFEMTVVIFMLVSACLITAGYRFICDSLSGDGHQLSSCMDAENFASWCGYDGSNFYVSLAVSTAGGWCLFVSWLMQGLLGMWKLWRLNMLPVLPLPCCKPDE
ncbi:hypothetical protein BsWGS_15339 [Bradybaena similaris]